MIRGALLNALQCSDQCYSLIFSQIVVKGFLYGESKQGIIKEYNILYFLLLVSQCVDGRYMYNTCREVKSICDENIEQRLYKTFLFNHTFKPQNAIELIFIHCSTYRSQNRDAADL
jgi:hypothetical protein